jgi:hypothetical protein
MKIECFNTLKAQMTRVEGRRSARRIDSDARSMATSGSALREGWRLGQR